MYSIALLNPKFANRPVNSPWGVRWVNKFHAAWDLHAPVPTICYAPWDLKFLHYVVGYGPGPNLGRGDRGGSYLAVTNYWDSNEPTPGLSPARRGPKGISLRGMHLSRHLLNNDQLRNGAIIPMGSPFMLTGNTGWNPTKTGGVSPMPAHLHLEVSQNNFTRRPVKGDLDPHHTINPALIFNTIRDANGSIVPTL